MTVRVEKRIQFLVFLEAWESGPRPIFPTFQHTAWVLAPNPVLLSQMLDNGFIDFIIVFFQDRDKLCCNIFN